MGIDFVFLALNPAEAVALNRLLVAVRDQHPEEDVALFASIRKSLDVGLHCNRLGEFSEGE